MWVSGIMQGLMWREYDEAGLPRLLLRRDRRGHAPLLPDPRARRRFSTSPAALLMAFNVWKTIRGDLRQERADGRPARRQPAQ